VFSEEEPQPGPSSAPSTPPERARAGAPVDPGRVLRALGRGRRTLLATTLLSGLGGVVIAKTLVPREYTATAVLQWEAPDVPASERDGRALATLVNNVKLPTNLEKVRARLALNVTVDGLGKRVEVNPLKESNVVSVSARAPGSEEAARLADTVVRVFLDHVREVDGERRREEVARLQASVAQGHEEVAAVRAVYDAFRRENGIADLPAETQVAIEQAARLQAQADAARAESEAELARIEKLRGAAREQEARTLLSETDALPATRKLGEARAELSSLRSQLAADHPRVQALEAQVAALEKPATAEPPAPVARVVGRNPLWDAVQQSLTQSGAQREAAITRREAFAELAGAAQARIDRLSQIETQASKRLARVRVAEAHLAELQARFARAADAARAPSSGFRVLAAPEAPPSPSKSRRLLVAALAPLVGLVLAALVSIGRALRGLRAHTAAEVSYWAGAPVVASSAWPVEAEALDDLVADLVEQRREAGGSLLLVGLSERETRFAEALARRLARAPGPGPAARTPGDGRARKKRARAASGELPPAKAPAIDVAPAGIPVAALRRSARGADRVLVVMESGHASGLALSNLATHLGRADGIGLVLIGLPPELGATADRAGAVDRFWGAAGTRRVQA
jgi:uncharacterized protein involved in exopolysaccharide biosynthesis